MVVLENMTNLTISIEHLREIAGSLTDKDIELILCDNDFIQTLNEIHRYKNNPTDVLSFPLRGNHTHEPLGSIVISMDKVKEKALEMGHLEKDELTLLFIHGLLHLLGYDHEKDAGEMREIEEKLIWRFHLPESLIVRTGAQ